MLKILYIFLIPFSLFASEINMAMTSMPSRLNPLLATDSASSEIAEWLFSALIKYDKNGKLAPEVAKSYRFIDNTTVEFTLQDNAKWSDGKKLTSADVVFTYQTITSPKVFTKASGTSARSLSLPGL